jgi:hypothetical protein
MKKKSRKDKRSFNLIKRRQKFDKEKKDKQIISNTMYTKVQELSSRYQALYRDVMSLKYVLSKMFPDTEVLRTLFESKQDIQDISADIASAISLGRKMEVQTPNNTEFTLSKKFILDNVKNKNITSDIVEFLFEIEDTREGKKETGGSQ